VPPPTRFPIPISRLELSDHPCRCRSEVHLEAHHSWSRPLLSLVKGPFQVNGCREAPRLGQQGKCETQIPPNYLSWEFTIRIRSPFGQSAIEPLVCFFDTAPSPPPESHKPDCYGHARNTSCSAPPRPVHPRTAFASFSLTCYSHPTTELVVWHEQRLWPLRYRARPSTASRPMCWAEKDPHITRWKTGGRDREHAITRKRRPRNLSNRHPYKAGEHAEISCHSQHAAA
jgi:hypothetical protein